MSPAAWRTVAATVVNMVVYLVLFGAGFFFGHQTATKSAMDAELGRSNRAIESSVKESETLASAGAEVATRVELSREAESRNKSTIAEVLANEPDFASMRRPPDLQRLRAQERDDIASAAMSGRNPGAGGGTAARAGKPDHGRE